MTFVREHEYNGLMRKESPRRSNCRTDICVSCNQDSSVALVSDEYFKQFSC